MVDGIKTENETNGGNLRQVMSLFSRISQMSKEEQESYSKIVGPEAFAKLVEAVAKQSDQIH